MSATEDGSEVQDRLEYFERLLADCFISCFISVFLCLQTQDWNLEGLKIKALLPINIFIVSSPVKPRGFAADILFLVDSSSDVTRSGHALEKEFVKSLADSLNLAPGKSRAAVILYSSYSREAIRFGVYPTTETFNSAVQDLPLLSGLRQIDQALDSAASTFQNFKSSSTKVLVLLTAGRHNPRAGSIPLDVAVQPLRDVGVETYVIAIGQQPDKSHLQEIVENPEDVISVPSFYDLGPQSKAVARHIANGSGSCSFFI